MAWVEVQSLFHFVKVYCSLGHERVINFYYFQIVHWVWEIHVSANSNRVTHLMQVFSKMFTPDVRIRRNIYILLTFAQMSATISNSRRLSRLYPLHSISVHSISYVWAWSLLQCWSPSLVGSSCKGWVMTRFWSSFSDFSTREILNALNWFFKKVVVSFV